MRKLSIPVPVAVLASLAIVAATAAVLYAMGRTPTCTCGYVKLFWWGPRAAAEESQHILDIYTVTHVLHGLLLYFGIWLVSRGRLSVGAALVLALLLESGWEIWENSNYLINRYRNAGVVYSGDSIINSMGDIAAMVLGFLIAAFAPVWISVLLLVAAEVGMALLIRDNLLLNIINLIHPIDWISRWQDLR